MLTPKFVSTVTVKDRRDFPDDKVKGLVLRVTPSGVKTWGLRYRLDGTSRRYTLGSTDNLSLSQARIEARRILYEVTTGKDPAEAKRQPLRGHTIDALVRDYIEHAKTKKRSWKTDVWRLNRHVLGQWRHRAVTEITRRDVRAIVEGIAAQGYAPEANHVKSLISTLFTFAIRREWCEQNPASYIDKAPVTVRQGHVLTDDEIRQFWQLCDQEPAVVATFLRLRLVTAQRGGELLQLTWADVDLESPRPAFTLRETKNGRAHHVPLSSTAKQLIGSLKTVSTRLFPGRDDHGGERRYMDAAGRVVDRMTTLARQADPSAVVDIRGHDLRRTAATRMAQAGVPVADVSRVLNHVEAGPRVTGTYQLYEFDREKRIALETWDRELQRILSESPTKAAIPFTRR